MKIFSEEWFGQYEPYAQSLFAPGRTPTAATGKFIEKYENVPWLKGREIWLTYEWEDGILIEQEHGREIKKAPRDADFVIGLDLSLPKKLLKKEIKPEDVMNSDAVEMRMDFIKLMPMVRPVVYMQLAKAIASCPLPMTRTLLSESVRTAEKIKRKALIKRGVGLK